MRRDAMARKIGALALCRRPRPKQAGQLLRRVWRRRCVRGHRSTRGSWSRLMLSAECPIEEIFDGGTAMAARFGGQPGENPLIAWIVGM